MRSFARFALILALFVVAPAKLFAFVITVTSAADGAPANDGVCTLREAIISANTDAASGAAPGECVAGGGFFRDIINFAIPGAGVHVISVSPAQGILPPITDEVEINGFSQPGASANTLASGSDAVYKIRIDGNGVGSSAPYDPFGLILAVGSQGSRIYGLVITRFGAGGMLVHSANNVIVGMFIGTNETGTASGTLGNGAAFFRGGITIESGTTLGNDGSISTVDVSGNIVGLSGAADRNLIAGNLGPAVSMNDISDSDTTTADGGAVINTYIGTNADGTDLIDAGEGGENGTGIALGGVSNVTIGTTTDVTPGGACSGSCNLIAGTTSAIILQSHFSFSAPFPLSSGITIVANFIGVDVTGTVALGSYDTIGATPATSGPGIVVNGNVAVTIGGLTAAARNVIAGLNGFNGAGIVINQGGITAHPAILVQGNHIGVNTSGTAVLANGAAGIHTFSAEGFTIGGTVAGARNVISGNLESGIVVESGDGSSSAASFIQGNYIGVLADGTTAAGNADDGVTIKDTADFVVVGAASPGGAGGNIIANNGDAGVAVSLFPSNTISTNSIYANASLGIDLEDDNAAEARDSCDPDTGANNLQNAPLLSTASFGAGNITVAGTLNSNPGTQFRLEFFRNPGGGDEGKIYLGTTTVTTAGNPTCDVAFVSPGFASAITAGDTVTATATNVTTGDTSEFSAAVAIGLPPPVVDKTFTPATIASGGVSTLSILITNPNSTILTGVQFVDTFPLQITRATTPNITNSCGGSASSSSGSLTLSGGAIAANGSCTVTIDVTSSTVGTHANSVVVSTNETTSGSDSANLAVLARPTIAKSFTPTSVAAGGNSLLTLTLGNTNAVAVTGAAVTDSLPAGLVVSNPNNLANSCGGVATAVAGSGSVSLSGGTIPASGTCTITVNVTSAGSGAYTNTIAAGALTSTNAGSNSAPASASVTFTGPPSIAKVFSPDHIAPGGSSTLTITITNGNASPVTGLAFTDTYPAGVTNTAAIPATTCTGGIVTAVAGSGSVSLSGGTVGASASCTVTVGVTSSAAGVHTNTIPAGALTSSAGANTAPATDDLFVNSPPAVAKSFNPSSISPNGTSTLTITLTNSNAVALTGAAFTDTYPAAIVNAAAPNGSTTCGGSVTAVAGGGSVGLSGGTIPASGSCTVTVTVTSSTAGSHVNTIPAGGVTTANGGSSTTAATATLNVVALTPPVATKSFTPLSVSPGQPAVLTVTLSNGNAAALTGVAFTDTYPAGLTNTAVPNASSTCGGTVTAAASGSSLALTGGVIPPSGNCTVSVTVTIAPGTVSAINTIPAGGVTSANAPPSITPATATLTNAASIPAISFYAMLLLGAVMAAAALFALRS